MLKTQLINNVIVYILVLCNSSHGSVVFSACRVLCHCSSIFEAELLACLEGTRIAADMDLSHITIESDCQTW
jgi:hypothetical protein